MQSATQPSTTWTTNGSAPGVRMAIFVRSDQRLVVFLRTSPLTARDATTIVRQPSTRSLAPAAEWRPFPTIVDEPKSTHITGSNTGPIAARLDTMQPPGSQGQAACTWDLAQSGAPPSGAAPAGGVAAVGASVPKGAVAPRNEPAAGAPTAPSTAPGKPTAGGAAARPVEPVRAPESTGATPPPATTAVASGCAAASGKVVNVSRGQSQTVTGEIKTSGSMEWLTLRFAPGTSVHLTLNNAAPAADASDFQLQAFSDCSSMIVMTTGTGEKTLDFPDRGPHAVLVRIVANQWKAASPTYSLKLEGR